MKVTNGEVIRTKGECKAIMFKMQGLDLEVNLSLLSLGGCGIVLGTQWLSTLGIFSWDFSKLMMGFKFHGKQVWLKGLKVYKPLLRESKQFGKGVAAQGLLLQIMQCSPCLDHEVADSSMQEVLEDFPRVFEEPQGLPPTRGHEHQILLKEGASQTCQRPYRYPYYQKSGIEKIMKDILDSWLHKT